MVKKQTSPISPLQYSIWSLNGGIIYMIKGNQSIKHSLGLLNSHTVN